MKAWCRFQLITRSTTLSSAHVNDDHYDEYLGSLRDKIWVTFIIDEAQNTVIQIILIRRSYWMMKLWTGWEG